MARALTPDEQTRYPWASQIVDYMPIGRVRKVALWAGGGGFALYLVGLLVIWVFSPQLLMENGLPVGVAETIVCVPAFLAMAVGFVLGLVTGVRAAAKQARPALAWSVAAMLPGLIVGIILLIMN
jgi:hypothetical protein